MKVKHRAFAFVALLLVIKVNCVRVIEDKTESTTKTESLEKSESIKESSESETTVKVPESLVELEPRIIDRDYHVTTSISATETASYTIAPTLVNAKHEVKEVTEAPEKTAKDVG